MREITSTLRAFCLDFLANPYQAYTEHGIHALFFTKLYNAIPEKERYFNWQNRKMCRIQKEYPTAFDLDKPTRQHWDISAIKMPPECVSDKKCEYDYFKLDSAIEFGLNEANPHLVEDIRRLTHNDSQVQNKYVVHLYRFSDGFSGRDWSPKSKRILKLKEIEACRKDDVEIHFVQFDSTGKHENGYWRITQNGTEQVK